jgi:hypothetical protein
MNHCYERKSKVAKNLKASRRGNRWRRTEGIRQP